jgi:tetratricopeptide (TPR) repeat protein
LTHAPESGAISYNLGNALYRQKRYEDAAAALGRAAQSQDAAVRHQSLHNLGNTFFESGKLPEALEAYRRALDADPTDLDTKINYEKALRELQHQQQQNQQKQQGQGKDDKQKQQDKGNSQQGQNQEQKQPGEPDQKQEQKPEPGQEGKTPQDQQQPGQPEQSQDAQMQPANGDTTGSAKGEMRKEEAMRILEAMRDQEEELLKERARQARMRARRVEKDW